MTTTEALALAIAQRDNAWRALGRYADRAVAAERVSAISPEDAAALLKAVWPCSLATCRKPGTKMRWRRAMLTGAPACDEHAPSDYRDMPHARVVRDLMAIAARETER